MLVAVVFGFAEVETRVVHGWWAGEAFYKGRPTSYWSRELRDRYEGRIVFDFDTVRRNWYRRPGLVLYWAETYWRRQTADSFPVESKTDPRAVPVLVQLLDHNSPRVRWGVCRCLAFLRGNARPAVAKLVALLDDEDETVRDEAESALICIAPGDSQAVVVLVQLLEHDSPRVRSGVCRCLGFYRDMGRPAVPKLVALLKDEDGEVRNDAGKALRAIDPDAAKAAGIE